MTLPPGARLGPYEVVAPLGAGGMGEVFRARDTKLGRDVALKVLPAAFASDPDRLMRFEREARTLAALNHPHIAQVYGLEEIPATINVGAARALVMELVEGEDLSARIARGPVPLEEALPIARQIAQALEAAHEAGIIHRDFKPTNIKLRADGTAKVLDFGLAKALDPPGDPRRSADRENSPTITSPALTMRGVILGTAAYMAPEQAKGKPVDKRADLWAFGCVLYEMLTGRRAFAGENATDIITAVLRDEPDWNALPASVPGSLRQALRLCMQKDPARRMPDAGTIRLVLDGAFDSAAPSAASATRPRNTALRVGWGIATVLAAVLAALGIASRSRGADDAVTAPPLKYEIPAPPDITVLQNAALSPDGRRLVFFTNTNNAGALWVRTLDSLELKQLAGVPPSVSSVAPPFFSPDSRFVAFWDGVDRRLKRVPVGGGVAQTVCDAPTYAGGSWAPDGTIVFGTRGAGLFRVPAAGGSAQPLTTLGSEEVGHINPSVLPDGQHLIFHVVSARNSLELVLTTIDGARRQVLLDDAAAGDGGGALYVPPSNGEAWGHLLYRTRQTAALMVRALNPATFESIGDDAVIATNVAFFAVSPAGLLAYREGAVVQGPLSRLVWMTRDGKEVTQVGPLGNHQDLRLSPDGRRAVFAQRDVNAGPYDIWVMDLVRNVPSRLTIEPSDDRFPAWSTDGRWLMYATGVGRAHSAMVRRDVGGAERSEVMVDGGGDIAGGSVSSDGQYALYRDSGAAGTKLMALKLSASPDRPRPTLYLDASYNEGSGVFMPSGAAPPSWVAYWSDETGRQEVYLQSFPAGSGKLQVSSGGGREPRWRADGKELYYVALDGRLMAVPVTLGSPPELGVATPLFFVGAVGNVSNYDVAPDGRFLVIAPVKPLDAGPGPQVTIVANWRATLAAPSPGR